MNIHLDYAEFNDGKNTPEDLVRNPKILRAFASLFEQIPSTETIAIYGSSFSGYVAYRLIETIHPGRVTCIFDRGAPLKELSHLPHIIPGEGTTDIRVDHVVVAASPRHYSSIEATLQKGSVAKAVHWMFARDSAPPLYPFMDFSGGTVRLPIFYRMKTGWEDVVEIPKKQLAVILIHIWDDGQERCPYCGTMEPFLEQARKHDLTIIHATGFKTDANGRFLHDEKQLSPKNRNFSNTWPPRAFSETADMLAKKNPEEHQREILAPPLGIHRCSLPQQRANEYVADDFDEVCNIFEKKKILYVLFAGGGSFQCLPFTTVGWVNIQRAGYHAILMRDLAPASKFDSHGKTVNMQDAATLLFEINCRMSTDSKRVIKALENS